MIGGSLDIVKKKKGKSIKKPPKLPAVYNLAPQCSKSNKVAPQTTKMQ
jgi:hypothetical protein